MVSALPPAMVRSPEIFVATPMSRPLVGAAVPMPTRPDDSCTTNCEPPTVKPCPLATVVVPLVVVNCPRPKYPVPLAVRLVVDAPPAAVKRPEAMVELACETNPVLKVASPLTSSVETRLRVPAERTPTVPLVLYRFVDDAVVLSKFVVVA